MSHDMNYPDIGSFYVDWVYLDGTKKTFGPTNYLQKAKNKASRLINSIQTKLGAVVEVQIRSSRSYVIWHWVRERGFIWPEHLIGKFKYGAEAE